jgi:hypothetical protein
MSKKRITSQSEHSFPWRVALPARHRAFFSFDAAIALFFAAAMLLGFAVLASAAGNAAQGSAEQESGNLLALRMSSFVLRQIEEKGGSQPAMKYSKEWVVDTTLLQSVDAEALARSAKSDFVRVSIHSSEGIAFSSSYGQAGQQVYCASRLALMGNRPVRLEVCTS